MNVEQIAALRAFIPPAQMSVILGGVAGEEREHFLEKLAEFAARTSAMPRVYEQEGKGDDAIAHLHYFGGSYDCWLTERDTSHAQIQAFGLARFAGNEPELGYVSLPEIFRSAVELDLYFAPTRLGDLRASLKAEVR